MGLFDDFGWGLLSGAVDAIGQVLGHGGGVGSLCAELGWDVDEWLDDRSCLLRFNTPGGVREVMAIVSESGGLGCFTSFSALKPAKLTPDVAAYLVQRNAQILPAWQVTAGGRGVTVAVCYRTFMAGLDAASFQSICKALVEEAADFDAKLRSSGML